MFSTLKKTEIVSTPLPGVTCISFPNMANVVASPASAAAANRDPAVDRSLRSVFGECFSLSCPVAAVYSHSHVF